MKTISALIAAIGAFGAISVPAQSLTWYWTAFENGTQLGSGQFITSDTYTGYAVAGTTWASPSPSGTVPFYTITSASGTFDGQTISGVLTDGTDGEDNYLFISPNLWAGYNMDAGGIVFDLNGNANDWVDLYSWQGNVAIDDNSNGTGVTTYNDSTTGFTLSNVAPTPEPSTMALSGLGLASLLVFRRRK